MIAYAIKLKDGTYWGKNKNHAQTLLGAQLYQSEKRCKSIVSQSWHLHENDIAGVVKVELREVDDDLAYGEIY